LVLILVQKYQVGPLVFFSFNLFSILEKMMQFGLFFVKFLKLDQGFSIKIKVVNNVDFLCWCNWHNPIFNFDEKSLVRFKKFNKNDYIASIFKNL